MNADDLFPGGLTFEDGFKVAEWAANEGADALHVTAGHYRSLPSAHMMTPPMNCAEGIFLDYAAQIRNAVRVPVIAVGRLGDPRVAMDGVDSGKADFIALGRALIADPQWVAKARAGEAVRRCLACNRCVDEMRSGEKLGCIVNPAAARELDYAQAQPALRGRRIAVIGAGPAGLAYAELAARDNHVTVFERDTRPGGALRHAALAPKFQNVVADEKAFDAYIDALECACREKGVVLRYGAEISDPAKLERDFDCVVIATGAKYRLGLTPVVHSLLESGWGKSRVARSLFDAERVRNWFYYRARKGTAPAGTGSANVIAIGDAAAPGKTREAIESAFKAALH